MPKAPLFSIAAVTFAVALGATVYLIQQEPTPEPVAATSTEPTNLGQASTTMLPPSDQTALTQPTPTQMPAADDARPADFSQEEWDQLLSAVKDHPDPQAELARLVTYLRYQRDLEHWNLAQPHTAERQEIGQRLLEALPTRLANREVTASEALLLQATIYSDLIPDEVERAAAIEQARNQLQRQIKNDPAVQAQQQKDQARRQVYKEREAEILSRFKAGQIDAAQFEKELQAVRVEVYQPAP